MSKATIRLLAAALVACGAPALADAQVTGGIARAWVSGHGADQAGCGVPAAPCRSLQYAHDNVVGAGGEIDVLDPAGYGNITIRKSVSIVNDGVGTAGVQTTSGDAITIAAGPSDSIYLRGLNVDGLGASGRSGIVFSTGAGLTVTNCVIRHFAEEGISLQPTSASPRVLIQDTIVADNNDAGILAGGAHWGSAGLVRFTLDRVTAADNNYGVYMSNQQNTFNALQVSLSNSLVSDNKKDGIVVTTAMFADVSHSVVTNNAGSGLLVQNAAIVQLSGSWLHLNDSDILNQTSGDGKIFTSGDNEYLAVGVAPTLQSLH